MAPLPPNNTARYKVFYTNTGVQHSFQLRSAGSPSAIGTFVTAFLNEIGPILPPTSVDEVTFAPTGSDIFNPVTTGIEGDTFGSAGSAPVGIAEFMSFIGRTAGGKRNRLYIYGVNAMSATDYRFSPLENIAVDNGIATLRANSALLTGIDGLPIVWKGYANAGVSAHWQKVLRP